MSGNTRGKIKEHFEGIHRNTEWSKAHVAKCLALIASQLEFTEPMVAANGDPEKVQAVLMAYPLYAGVKAIGESLEAFDDVVNGMYAHL